MLCLLRGPLVGSTSEAMAAACICVCRARHRNSGVKRGCPLSTLADDTNCATVECLSTGLFGLEKKLSAATSRSERRLVCATKRVESASAAFPNGTNVPRCRTGVKKRCGWSRRFLLSQTLIGEWSKILDNLPQDLSWWYSVTLTIVTRQLIRDDKRVAVVVESYFV